VSVGALTGVLDIVMNKMVKLELWAIVAALFGFAVLWIGGLLDVPQALGEYLRPTTIEGMYIPPGCTRTNEAPPPDLMRIVAGQEKLYHLTLQRVVVCRSTLRLLDFEQRHAGLPLGEDDPCRRLPKGCCGCQFQRHVIVMVADPSARGGGSVLVHANLIQSRWDYLRLRWNKGQRASWFWWWPLAGILVLVFVLRTIVKT
jgi:hypothetical protein